MNGTQPLWADNYIRAISQSKMGLNLSQGTPIKYYSSDRVAQLIGNGLLTFIDEKTKFNHFFTNSELVFYKNIEDLSEKMQKLSIDDNLRRKIAKKGWFKDHKFFNSQMDYDYMINKIFMPFFHNH